MTMNQNCIKVLCKGALFGGLVAFAWMNISWMLLPWHGMTISTLPDETTISESIKSTVSDSGLYILPWSNDHSEKAMDEFNKKMEIGPFAYMIVHPNGLKVNMPLMMIYGLLFNIFVAFMLTYLLTKTTGLSYIQKVGFVKVAALSGAIVIIVPNLIWWHFPLDYTIVTFIDTGITWGLAGMAIAKVVKN